MSLHIFKIIIVLLLVNLLTGCSVMKSSKSDKQQHKTFHKGSYNLDYLLYLPSIHGNDKHFPLVLFLHGSGERGDKLDKVKTHGPPMLVRQGKEFPFILVSPQCPDGKRWNVSELSALLDDIEKNYSVDKARIYVTGLSMGGYGTWSLASANPKRFAAILPVCGGGDFLNACMLKDVPAWVFHGAKDKVVSVQESERMVDAIKRCGGNPRFTVYPEAGHDSWTETYNNPEVYNWLLSQRKN
jgi:predicted peptidase